jgi:ABC-type sugar transport system substrate-binding protein
MRKLALALGFVAMAPAMAAAAPMGAAKSYPWCLIIQDQDDGWACGFKTFEQCQVEARAGNTRFCAANPAYQAPAQPARPRKRRQAR